MPQTITLSDDQKNRSVRALSELYALGVLPPACKSGEVVIIIADNLITTVKLAALYDSTSVAVPTGDVKNVDGYAWTSPN